MVEPVGLEKEQLLCPCLCCFRVAPHQQVARRDEHERHRIEKLASGQEGPAYCSNGEQESVEKLWKT